MEDKKPKVGRTVKLEHDMNERLIALCKHLCVNPNAYLLNEIGKCISRDEVAYKASQHTSNMGSMIQEMFTSLQEQQK